MTQIWDGERRSAPVEAVSAWNDLVLDDDRREFAETIERHLSDRFPLERMRTALDAEDDPLDGWSDVVENGYSVVGLPEQHDGIGGLLDATVVAEAAGRSLLTLPLVSTMAAAHVAVAAGLAPTTVEPATLARTTGRIERGRVEAEGVLALDARHAHRITLIGDGPDGAWVAVVDPAATGVQRRARHVHIDPSRPLDVLDLADVEPLSLAEAPDADSVLAPAHVLRAADLTGQAAGALATAVDHVLGRQQFGRPLGAFQAVKHALADGYVLVERARSLTRAAAIAHDDGTGGLDPARTLPLLADAAASEAALRVAELAVQLHGAMGLTFEADPQLYLRRARQTAGALEEIPCLYRRVGDLHRKGVTA